MELLSQRVARPLDLTTPDGEMVAALESQDEMCGKKQG
jgi:hypothetical protein